jgi:hypothetical protein
MWVCVAECEVETSIGLDALGGWLALVQAGWC